MQQDARPERIPIRGARAHDAKVGRGARTEPKTSLNKGQKTKKKTTAWPLTSAYCFHELFSRCKF